MVGDTRTLSPLLLPPSPNYSFGTFIKSQVPNPVPLECWHFEDQVRSSEEEDSRIQHCHSLKSGGILDTLVKVWFFQNVEEVVSCGDPLGQLGDPLGPIQAAGIYLKSCLGVLPCL